MTQNAPPVPRGCGWALLVSGGLFAILGTLSLAAIPIVWQRSQEVWTEAQGTVTASSIEQGERRSNQHRSSTRRRTKTYSSAPTYQVLLAYSYEAAGERRTGTAHALEQPTNDEVRTEAVAILETYPQGRALPVFYHPQDPGQSRLTAKEDPREFVWDVVFGLFFTLIGVGSLFIGRLFLKR